MCSRRSFVSAVSSRCAIFCPAIVISPEVGLSSPASRCMSVDLPEPDGPMTAVSLPPSTSSETLRSAWTAVSPSPYVRVQVLRGDDASVRGGVRFHVVIDAPLGELTASGAKP